MNTAKSTITVEVLIDAPLETVWEKWTSPQDIIHWNSASDDWHTPRAENNPVPGGKFLWRMEAKDGSMGFDFGGVYDIVKRAELLEYTIGDGRKVKVTFANKDGKTKVSESFEAEDTNALEMQKAGWQAILDNFKKYTESKK